MAVGVIGHRGGAGDAGAGADDHLRFLAVGVVLVAGAVAVGIDLQGQIAVAIVGILSGRGEGGAGAENRLADIAQRIEIVQINESRPPFLSYPFLILITMRLQSGNTG